MRAAFMNQLVMHKNLAHVVMPSNTFLDSRLRSWIQNSNFWIPDVPLSGFKLAGFSFKYDSGFLRLDCESQISGFRNPNYTTRCKMKTNVAYRKS